MAGGITMDQWGRINLNAGRITPLRSKTFNKGVQQFGADWVRAHPEQVLPLLGLGRPPMAKLKAARKGLHAFIGQHLGTGVGTQRGKTAKRSRAKGAGVPAPAPAAT